MANIFSQCTSRSCQNQTGQNSNQYTPYPSAISQAIIAPYEEPALLQNTHTQKIANSNNNHEEFRNNSVFNSYVNYVKSADDKFNNPSAFSNSPQKGQLEYYYACGKLYRKNENGDGYHACGDFYVNSNADMSCGQLIGSGSITQNGQTFHFSHNGQQGYFSNGCGYQAAIIHIGPPPGTKLQFEKSVSDVIVNDPNSCSGMRILSKHAGYSMVYKAESEVRNSYVQAENLASYFQDPENAKGKTVSIDGTTYVVRASLKNSTGDNLYLRSEDGADELRIERNSSGQYQLQRKVHLASEYTDCRGNRLYGNVGWVPDTSAEFETEVPPPPPPSKEESNLEAKEEKPTVQVPMPPVESEGAKSNQGQGEPKEDTRTSTNAGGVEKPADPFTDVKERAVPKAGVSGRVRPNAGASERAKPDAGVEEKAKPSAGVSERARSDAGVGVVEAKATPNAGVGQSQELSQELGSALSKFGRTIRDHQRYGSSYEYYQDGDYRGTMSRNNGGFSGYFCQDGNGMSDFSRSHKINATDWPGGWSKQGKINLEQHQPEVQQAILKMTKELKTQGVGEAIKSGAIKPQVVSDPSGRRSYVSLAMVANDPRVVVLDHASLPKDVQEVYLMATTNGELTLRKYNIYTSSNRRNATTAVVRSDGSVEFNYFVASNGNWIKDSKRQTKVFNPIEAIDKTREATASQWDWSWARWKTIADVSGSFK